MLEALAEHIAIALDSSLLELNRRELALLKSATGLLATFMTP